MDQVSQESTVPSGPPMLWFFKIKRASIDHGLIKKSNEGWKPELLLAVVLRKRLMEYRLGLGLCNTGQCTINDQSAQLVAKIFQI